MRQRLFHKTKNHRSNLYIGNVGNTIDNMERLQDFRRTLRQVMGTKLKIRGRHPDRKWLAKETNITHKRLRQDVPLKYAMSFAVYFVR